MGRNSQRHHGLPPRPPPGRSNDSYRPPPPPPYFDPPQPPTPPPGPPGVDMRDAYMDQDSSWQAGPPQGDFTFRVDMPSAIEEAREHNTYRPNDGRRARDRDRDYRDRRGGDRDRDRLDRDRFRDRNRDRRQPPNFQQRWNPYQKPHASDRQLLQTRSERTDLDFAQEGEGATAYKSFDDLSDSEEADMDISDSGSAMSEEEAIDPGSKGTTGTAGNQDSERNDGGNQDGPAPKRARTSQSSKDPKAAADQDSAPKWSNPDPYTAIPPPDESRRRRDMVQLIRKARVQGTLNSRAAVKEESDFISLEDSAGVNSKLSVPSLGTPAEVSRTAGSLGKYSQNESPSIGSGLSHQLPTNSLPQPPHLAYGTNNNPATLPQPVNLTPSSDFGSRKRTHDDEIKPLSPLPPAKPASNKKKNGMSPDGNILSNWRLLPDREVKDIKRECPWLQNHNESPIPVILSKETTDLYHYMKARPHEQEVRQDIIHRLGIFLSKRYPGSELKSFGSFQNGLYLPTGDMDLVLLSRGIVQGDNRVFPKGQCYSVGRALEGSGIAHAQTMQVIAKAKVPLTKFVDSTTGLNVDISFDKLDGVNAVQTFNGWKQSYPIMEPLVLIIKHFLAMRGLNEPVNGGIGGFSVICLVVSMLQHDASIQAGQPGQLGELLVRFFRLYGKEFNFRDVAIQTNPPGLVNKRDLNIPYKNPDRISIIDPNNPDNDISGGSSNTSNIVRAFGRAYDSIVARLDQAQKQMTRQGGPPSEPISILSCIFAADYWLWNDRRNRLEEVYEKHKSLYSSVARQSMTNPPTIKSAGVGNRNNFAAPRAPTNGGNTNGSNRNTRQGRPNQSGRSNGRDNEGGRDGRGGRGGSANSQNRAQRRQDGYW